MATSPALSRRAIALAAALALVPTAGPAAAAPAGPSPRAAAGPAKQVELLDRGLISVRAGTDNTVSWRLLGTDPAGVAFTLYRDGTRLTGFPLTGATTFSDRNA